MKKFILLMFTILPLVTSCSIFKKDHSKHNQSNTNAMINSSTVAYFYNWNPVEQKISSEPKTLSEKQLKLLKTYLSNKQNFFSNPVKKSPFLPNVLIRIHCQSESLSIFIAEHTKQLKLEINDYHVILNYNNSGEELNKLIHTIKSGD